MNGLDQYWYRLLADTCQYQLVLLSTDTHFDMIANASTKVFICLSRYFYANLLLFHSKAAYAQYRRLYSQMDECLQDAASCQMGCTTGLSIGCITYTHIFLFDQLVVHWVVSCKWGLRNGCPQHWW